MEFQNENLQIVVTAIPGINFLAVPDEDDIEEGDWGDEDDEDFDDELDAKNNLDEIRQNEAFRELDPDDDDHLPDDDLQ
jgi:hypothetical protein